MFFVMSSYLREATATLIKLGDSDSVMSLFTIVVKSIIATYVNVQRNTIRFDNIYIQLLNYFLDIYKFVFLTLKKWRILSAK